MNNTLNRLVKRILDILFFTGIAAEAAMPLLLRLVFLRYDFLTAIGPDGTKQIIMPYYISKLIFIMAAGVLALLILHELRRMMATVIDGDCFIDENTRSLSRMGRYALIISVLMFCSNFSAPTMTAGVVSLVLAGVFERAVRYKQENDLTI